VTQAPPQTTFASVVVRTEPEPRVRYLSGLTIYDEALVDGRWIGRYWSAVGRVKPEVQLARDLPELADERLDAFHLAVDGQPLDGRWEWEGLEEREGTSPAGRPRRRAVVGLRHRTAPLAVRVHTELDGSPFLVRWLEIENRGERPVAITDLACWSGLLWRVRSYNVYVPPVEGSAFRLGYNTASAWGYEGDFAWEPLGHGTKRLENRTGDSGWGRPAFVAANEGQGDFFVVELAWSGNWWAELSCRQDLRFRADQRGGGLPDARLRAAIGLSAGNEALRVVAAGETVASPAVHIANLHGDLDRVTQERHAHVRGAVLPPQVPGRGQRITCNPNVYLFGPEGMTEESLREQIDIAASVGAELFYIDCGWHGREKLPWPDIVGDWMDAPWLPDGVGPVREHARAKGLLFGLWMEPESIGHASQLRRDHPDWEMQRNGDLAARRNARPGGLLDITRPEVAAWVESQMAAVLERHDLDFFRLDFNTRAFEDGNRVVDGVVENLNWRRVEALYGILDRLRARFPRVIFENCASGGARTDLGILRRFHTTWISDWQREPRGVQILNGTTLALPPEICNRLFGPIGFEFAAADFDYQLREPLFGHAMYKGAAPTLHELDPVARDRIAHHVRLYKEFMRPILPTARVYHHTPVLPMTELTGWCVLEYASPDAERGYAGLFRLNPVGEDAFDFRPRGLARGRRYRVTFENERETAEMSGLELTRGIPIRLERALTSQLLLFEAL
jgi:alpha-galactosidase